MSFIQMLCMVAAGSVMYSLWNDSPYSKFERLALLCFLLSAGLTK